MKNDDIVAMIQKAKADEHRNLMVSRRAHFLSLASKIKFLIEEEKTTVLFIYRTLVANKIINYSYSTFNRFVNEYVKKNIDTVITPKKISAGTKKEKIIQSQTKEIKPETKHQTQNTVTKSDSKFTMVSSPDIEDLI